MTTGSLDWVDLNQRALTAQVARVLGALERRCGRPAREAGAVDVPAGSTLDTLCRIFGLTAFERDVLLLCAAVELDGATTGLCADAHGDPQQAYPTFGLALAALDEPHWSALVPAAPLRYWRLVELDPRLPVTSAPLRAAERIVHHLTGIDYLDDELAFLLAPVVAEDDVVPSQEEAAERAARLVVRGDRPVVQVCGPEPACTRAVAAAAARLAHRPLFSLGGASIPTHAPDEHALRRLWAREAALVQALLVVDCHELDGPGLTRAVERFLDRLDAPVLVASREPLAGLARTTARVDASKPTADEQRELWRAALGKAATGLDGSLDSLVSHFDVDVRTIRSAAAQLRQEADGRTRPLDQLWQACRSSSRPRLDELAQRIFALATWDDLVLPERQLETLREVATHVRHRTTVYETWGFAARSSRGLGIAALFAGPTGTGKTMAAEVVANELELDLYRIDLSQVVSKYIGETEKNLRRVFDAAEGTGAILLFDEADALFGKRTEVRDSHDRYANVEISYLLQRMEAYRGLAILTTNLQDAIDAAFLRRIRFVVQFPFPDLEQRREIWRRVFPAATPVDELDVERLAQLGLAGGSIRNVGLNAAFLAADAGRAVGMEHLEGAAESEYAKLGQPLPARDLGSRE